MNMGLATKYNGGITTEKFLFHEMRVTARLLDAPNASDDPIKEILQGNLYQYPTNRNLRKIARACIRRIKLLNSPSLIHILAEGPAQEARGIVLYAIMRDNRLIREFMLDVIADKFRTLDGTLNAREVSLFLFKLQEKDESVASWSKSTIGKIREVLIRCLAETGFIASTRFRGETPLSRVIIEPSLVEAISNNGDDDWAFLIFSHLKPSIA
jgi:hypothetical protein